MIRSLLPVCLILLLSGTSCNVLKLSKLLKKGSTSEESFREQIPFEYRMDLVIIPVVINGKTYEFMVDTGAPNVVSKELAAELGKKTVVSQRVGDSQGESSRLDFILLDTVSIGGLDYVNTAAAIADLKQSNMIACLKVDGFIGANLMRKAIWEFDYEHQLITMVSSREQLSIPSDAAVLPFVPAASGTPKVSVQYNGHREDFLTFDTGANGHFTSTDRVYQLLKETNDSLRTIYGIGQNTSGLFGQAGHDTTDYAIVSVKAGDLPPIEQVVSFKKEQSKLMGTAFLKNFRVIIDWPLKEILLIPSAQPETARLEGFGFTISRSKDNHLLTSFIYHGSHAEKLGMEIGDRIIRIDSIDFSILTDDSWCELVYNGTGGAGAKSIEVTILKGEEQRSFRLDKQVLLGTR